MLDTDIKRENMVPGSGCDTYTRPEEIKALSKYLKKRKDYYDSLTESLNKDNIEVQGARFLKDPELPTRVEGLIDDRKNTLPDQVETIERVGDLELRTNLETIESAGDIELPEDLDTLTNELETALSELREELVDTRENIELEDNKELIEDTREGELSSIIDQLESGEALESLEDYREEIQGNEDRVLEDHKEVIKDSLDESLENHKEVIEDNQDETLEDHKEEIKGNESQELEDYKERISDSQDESLEDYREGLKDSLNETLEDHKEELTDSPDENLEDHKEGLSDNPNETLEDYQEKINDNQDESLEDHKEGLSDDPNKTLENHREELTDSPDERLEDHKEVIKDSTNEKLEDYQEKIQGNEDQVLEDHKENLTENQDENLEDYKEGLSDSLDENLEDYKEKLSNSLDENLEDHKERISDSSDEELENHKENIQGNEDPELENHQELIKDSQDEALEDHKEVIKDSLDESLDKHKEEIKDSLDEKLESHKEELSDNQEEKLEDYRESLKDSLNETLEDHKETIKDSLDETLEDHREEINGNEDQELGDFLDTITGNQTDIQLGTYKEGVIPSASDNSDVDSLPSDSEKGAENFNPFSWDGSNLSDYIESLSYDSEESLVDYRDDLTDNTDETLEDYKDEIEGTTDKDLEDYKDQIQGASDKELVDYQDKISDSLDETLEDFIDKKDKAEDKELVDYQDKISDNLDETLEDFIDKKDKAEDKELVDYQDKISDNSDETLEDFIDKRDKAEDKELSTFIEKGEKGEDQSLSDFIDKKDKAEDKELSTFVEKRDKPEDQDLSKFVDKKDKAEDKELSTFVEKGNKGEDQDLSDFIDKKDKAPDQELYPNNVLVPEPGSNFQPFLNPEELDKNLRYKLVNRVYKLAGKIHNILKLTGDPSKDPRSKWVEQIVSVVTEVAKSVEGTNEKGEVIENTLDSARDMALEEKLYKVILENGDVYKMTYVASDDPGQKKVDKLDLAEYGSKILYGGDGNPNKVEDFETEDLKQGEESIPTAKHVQNQYHTGILDFGVLAHQAVSALKVGNAKVKAKLIEEALAGMVLARELAEVKAGLNRDRLPGESDEFLTGKAKSKLREVASAALYNSNDLQDLAKSAVISAAKCLLPDTVRPHNRPDEDSNNPTELLSGKTTWYAMSNKQLGTDEKDVDPGNKVKFTNRYLKGEGIKQTFVDLVKVSRVNEINTVEDMFDSIKESPYMTSANKFTSSEFNSVKVITLDSNMYWEIILEPFMGAENNEKTYLPLIHEINVWNKYYHNVRTGYTTYLPITSFELAKGKLTTKNLQLFDGEIAYPTSMEFTNEFKLTFVDDQFKSLRTYFERCLDSMIYYSEPKKKDEVTNINPYEDNTLTAVDKRYQLVAPYKNVTFRCRIYSMTPQLSTISKYDLLLVLRDFVEERSGDIEGDGGDLSVNFSIVGENPKSEETIYDPEKTSLKAKNNDFEAKMAADRKKASKIMTTAKLASEGLDLLF